MKKETKRWIALTVSMLIVILIVSLQVKNHKLKADKELQEIELSTLKDEVSLHKAKNGEITYKLNAVEVEKNNSKKALEATGFEIKDLKNREIDYRKTIFALKSKLEATGSGEITLHDTVYVETHTTDTIRAITNKWNNGYLYLNPIISGRKMIFDYTYRTGISIISTSREGKSTVVNVALSDPNASIISSNAIVIPDKKRWRGWKWIWYGAGVATGYAVFR